MTPEQIDRVFGRGRLKMATGDHVEVFREAVAAGERRRYTKRFLNTCDGDYGQWTEREWRILARLIGHGIGCVPDVVQFDRGARGGTQIVQTYDAGATVDQWATILPVERNARVYRHVFEDCAHWWALAHHCLSALHAIHDLQLVHLDVKGDNVCIPVGPPSIDPDAPGAHLYPQFGQLALIDFAFSLISREMLTSPLPIGWQKNYDYQSPRLLHALEAGRNGDLQPTRELDWRCDMYSLAAMLKRYLPDDDLVRDRAQATGWSPERYHAAKVLILAIRDAHDREACPARPHHDLLRLTGAQLADADMIVSLEAGWTLARDANVATVPALPLTPLTRLAPSVRVTQSPNPALVSARPPIASAPLVQPPRVVRRRTPPTTITARVPHASPAATSTRAWVTPLLLALIGVSSVIAVAPHLDGGPRAAMDGISAAIDRVRHALDDASGATADTPFQRSAPDRGEALGQAPSAANDDAQGDASAAPDQQVADEPATASAPPSPPPAPAPPTLVAPSGVSASAGERAPASTAPPVNAGVDVSASANAHAERTLTAPASVALPAPTGAALPAPAGTPRRSLSATQASRRAATQASTASTDASGSTAAKPRGARSAAANERAARSSTVKQASGTARTQRLTRAESASRMPPASPGKAPLTVATTAAPPADAPGIDASTGDTPKVPAVTPSSSAPAAPTGVAPDGGQSTAQSTKPAESAPAAADQRVVAQPSGPGDPRRVDVSREPRRVDAPRAQAHVRPGFLTSLLNLAKRGGKAAPIEERPAAGMASASRETRTPTDVAPREAPVKGALATASSPPAARRIEPVRAVPPAAEPARLVVEPIESMEASTLGRASDVISPTPLREPLEQAAARPPSRPSSPTSAYAEGLPVDRFPDARDDWTVQARRVLHDSVPRTAAYAEPEIAQVLASAATAFHPAQQQAIVNAARRPWGRNIVNVAAATAPSAAARRLKDDARRAFWAHRNIDDAFDLQLRAFGADPYDAEVASNLASLYLQVTPPQPRIARQVVMHAMALSSAQLLAPRVQDWNTLAVASALMGREDDAAHALFVTSAIANNLGVSCRAALNAVAHYGDRMRAPVESMLLRIREQGRDYESPFCVWPPRWTASGRFY